MDRALEKLRAGSGNKGSLWSGQERICCHLLKALSGAGGCAGEKRGAYIGSTELTQGKAKASNRHWHLDNQLVQHLMVQKGKLVTPEEWQCSEAGVRMPVCGSQGRAPPCMW